MLKFCSFSVVLFHFRERSVNAQSVAHLTSESKKETTVGNSWRTSPTGRRQPISMCSSYQILSKLDFIALNVSMTPVTRLFIVMMEMDLSCLSHNTLLDGSNCWNRQSGARAAWNELLSYVTVADSYGPVRKRGPNEVLEIDKPLTVKRSDEVGWHLLQ